MSSWLTTTVNGLRYFLNLYFPSPSEFNYRPDTPAGIWIKLSKNPFFEKYVFKNVYETAFVFVGCMITLASIGALDYYVTRPAGFPILLPALGASATIMFQKPDSPFTQSYHILVGHTLCPALAVSLHLLFPGLPWLAAALATSLSISVMGLVGGVNPPGGALAMLYPLVPELHVLGYKYIPASLAGIGIMWIVGFVINNLQRHLKYPYQWI
jgi:CBS-domain-containing membrane protein